MPDPQPFVSSYSWLIAPGDRVQNDYVTPTVIKRWLLATEPTTSSLLVDKQLCYGQWLAQVLQNQLGVNLVDLYATGDQKEWPLTLRDDVVARLDEYFRAKEATEAATTGTGA